MTEVVAAFVANTFNDTELWKSFLAAGNTIINFVRQERHG